MIEYSVVETGPLAENCYLLWGAGRQAWVVDPGADPDLILGEIAARGLTPCAIVLTHGHFDHVGALDALLAKWPDLPVLLRDEDAQWAFTHPMNQYPPFYAHQKPPATRLAPGETWARGGIEATFIHTPGHTPGGQCVLLTRDVPSPICLTGDTLFQGSVGRTDLPGGSFAALDASVRHLAQALPPETTLLPGHGPATTLERELRSNPYLQPDPGF